MTQKTLTKPFNELTPQELERRKNFDCGEQSLNDYLTNRMRQHDEKNIAKSFLSDRGFEKLTPLLLMNKECP